MVISYCTLQKFFVVDKITLYPHMTKKAAYITECSIRRTVRRSLPSDTLVTVMTILCFRRPASKISKY